MGAARATRTAARATGQPRTQKQHAITPDAVPGYISKTRMCSFFLSGACARGGSCTFAHGKHELKAKPDFSRTQLCAKGASCDDPRCAFAHDEAELRILAPKDLSTLTSSQPRTAHKRSPTATPTATPAAAKQQPTPRSEPPPPAGLRGAHARAPTAAEREVLPHGEPPLPVWLQHSVPGAHGQLRRKELSDKDLTLPMKINAAELLSFESTWEESTCDGSQSSKSDESEPCHVQLPISAWTL